MSIEPRVMFRMTSTSTERIRVNFQYWTKAIMKVAIKVEAPVRVLPASSQYGRTLFCRSCHCELRDYLRLLIWFYPWPALNTFKRTYGQSNLEYTCLYIDAGEHITPAIRVKYLEQCLRQNIAFFDHAASGEMTARMTADTNKIQIAISREKLSP